MIQLHVSAALRRVGQVWAFDLVFVAVAGFPNWISLSVLSSYLSRNGLGSCVRPFFVQTQSVAASRTLVARSAAPHHALSLSAPARAIDAFRPRAARASLSSAAASSPTNDLMGKNRRI